MTNQIFTRYGPGLLYGRNTIMAYLDDLTRINCKAVDQLTPNLNNQPKGKRQNLIDELKELEEIRSVLKKSFIETLEIEPPKFPKSIEQTLPKLEAPFHILRDVIIPIIEQISTKTPESIPQFLETMNQFLTNNAPTEVWDVPKVSEKVTQWMKKALIMPNCDQASILQFWLKFIKLRAKIEDVLVLASVWFEHQVPDDKLTLIPMLLSDIKLEVSKCSFIDFIENPTNPLTVSYNPIMIENLSPPSSLSEQPKRKCVAHGGFVYVMDSDPKIGFSKFGDGKCGTIFGQTEIITKNYINRNPVSIAFCNELILVRFADSPSNEILIIDPATLNEVGRIENTEILPSGPFTAFKNTFYVVYQKSINSYLFDGRSLKFIKTTEIKLNNGQKEFIPDSKLALANLFTDGIFMNVVFTPKDDSSATVISCSLETGDFLDSPPINDLKLSPYVSFDDLAKTLIMIPNWTPASIYNYSERYNFQILFGDQSTYSSPSNNACLNLLNTIIPSSISKISPGIINYNRHYVLNNGKPLYELIELCFKDERYSVFLQPAIILLTIRCSEVAEDPLITLDLLCSILTSNKITSTTKIALLKALIKHGNTPLFNTLDKCSRILQNLNDQEIIDVFTENGFNDIFTFAMTFLIKPYDRVLHYAAENSKKAYPFISNLTFTVLRGVLVKKCFSPTCIFPIIEITTKCDKSILPTLVPPLLPLIEQITKTVLESKKYTDILLRFTSNLLQYASIVDLQSFANFHAESREKPKYFTKTTVEESPHPYDNDMRVVHNYDFPGAVELVIEFDKKTATENGCDYLQIFTDEEMKKELTPMLSGKYSKWPPPIKTQSQHLTFHFYSDTSITDWGYRATITAKFVATRKFSSPESFFDLSYSLIDILYSYTKRLIDEKRTKQSYPQFKIPPEVISQQLSESQIMELKTKLKGKVDGSILNMPTTLPSFYTTIDYLVNNNMFDKSLVDIMLSPPDYIITETQDPKEIFTSLASFIMTNNLCELPQSRFSFLTNVIKGTDDAYSFALDLIKKAQDVLQDSNPKNLLSAANYIQTAFKIDNESIQKEGKDVIGKFLNTLSHSCLPLNMPLASSLIEKSQNLFKIVLPSLTNVAQFLQKACDSLDSIEPNLPDRTIPFINFALSVILVLKPDENSKPFITRLILSSLKFNMPNTISLISQAVEKFNIQTNIKESPILKEIFNLIGKDFSTETPTPTTTIKANLSPSFMIARAAILRRLIQPESISDFVPIIEKHDDASFGVLLVLSQRFLPPFPSQRVRLISNNKIVTLTGMDYKSYHFKTDSGIDFSIPAANYNKFVFFNQPFTSILPSEFPKASNELISAVENCITNANNDRLPFSLFAKWALSELSISSPLDSKLIQWPSLTKPVEKQKHQIIEATNSHFKQETGQILYRMNYNTNCVTFIAQGQMTVGFSSKNSLSSAFIAPIKISNNYITFENDGIKLHFDSPEVTIGLFGPYKQVFIQSGKLFAFTQLFLGSLEDPQPFFLTEKIPQLVVPKDFPSFLFYTKHSKSFSHIHCGERLYSINDDLYKPKKLSEFQFLPPLKTNTRKYIYLEISTTSKIATFSLVNETIKAHILYQNDLSDLPDKAFRTIGIYISFYDKEKNILPFVFMTYNGQYVESSVARINMTEQISLFVYFNEAVLTSINTGSRPFAFDVDAFMSKFKSDNLPIREPFIDNKKAPTEISTLVCSDKETEDFLTPNNKFRSVPLERPIFIPSSNIVTSYIPSTHKESSDCVVNVYSDYIKRYTIKSDKIISLTESLTTKKAQSIGALERIQNSMPQFISPFLFFKSNKREELCQNLLTKKRKDAYFDNINSEAQFSIALNTISRFSSEQIDSFENLEQFIINSASSLSVTPLALLNGEYNILYGRALQTIFDKKPSLFESLAKKALEYLVNDSFHPSSTIVLSSSNKKPIDVSQTDSDFIYLRVLPQSVIQNTSEPQIKGLNIDGRKSILESNSQELFDGPLFTIQNIKQNEILYVKLIPIKFNRSPLSFSLQLINFMIKTKETWNLLHSEILYPLFNHIQKGKDTLFPTTYASWFNKSFINKTISREMMVKYSNSINFYQIGSLSDELCSSFLLFGLYCHTNSVKDNDLKTVRERTVNYLDTLVSIKENFSSYKNEEIYNSLSSKGIAFATPPITPSCPSLTFEGIILRISMALISPFENKLQFLGLVGELNLPVMTAAAYLYSKNSQYSPQTITINLDDVTSPTAPIVIDDNNYEGIYLKLNKKIQEGIIYVNDNCVRESQTIFTTKNPSTNKKNPISIRIKKSDAILQIIPIYNQSLPTVNDFTKLYQYYNELKEKLTIQIDSDLISIAQNLILKNIYFTSLLDDSSLRSLFPSISPESIRYRISCHIISLMKDGSCVPLHKGMDSIGFCSLQHTLGSVIINKRSKFSNSNNNNVNDVIEKSNEQDNMFGMLPNFVLKYFENGETDFTAFFAKLLNLIESVPMRLRANAPTHMTNSTKTSSSNNNNDNNDENRSASGVQTNDQDQDEGSGNNSSQPSSAAAGLASSLQLLSSSSLTITKYLRTSQNKLFEEKDGGLFVPRKDANDKNSIDAFQGFGALLGLRFVSGRSPPLPVSRLVLKAAFGGEINQDDIQDSNLQMEDVQCIQMQLEAIRIGVELAVPRASSIIPSDTFARVFQVAPRLKPTLLSINIPENLTDPVLFPSLRRAIISSHVKFQPEDKQKNIIDEIFQKQADVLKKSDESKPQLGTELKL